jgi:hypothetical protein
MKKCCQDELPGDGSAAAVTSPRRQRLSANRQIRTRLLITQIVCFNRLVQGEQTLLVWEKSVYEYMYISGCKDMHM